MTKEQILEAVQAATAAVREAGCVCDVEFHVQAKDDTILLNARHDPWCPLLRMQDVN